MQPAFSPRTFKRVSGEYKEPNQELSIKNFAISLHARAAAFVRMGEDIKVLKETTNNESEEVNDTSIASGPTTRPHAILTGPVGKSIEVNYAFRVAFTPTQPAIEGTVITMERKKSSDFDPQLLSLFHRYVHGGISRREFLDGATKFAIGGLTATALWDMLRPNYALAQQVAKDDQRIKAEYTMYPSPKGTRRTTACADYSRARQVAKNFLPCS